MVWADRAALRAETPHAGHVRAEGPHEHRLVLPEDPGREDALQVQALIDSAVAKIGNNPDWKRVQKSIQLGPDAPTILINVRADRKDTSSKLTVAFGNSGAVRQPYDVLLRGGPDAMLERIRTATDYEFEPATVEPPVDRGGPGLGREVLNPATDPAMVSAGSAARRTSDGQQTANERSDGGRWHSRRSGSPQGIG